MPLLAWVSKEGEVVVAVGVPELFGLPALSNTAMTTEPSPAVVRLIELAVSPVLLLEAPNPGMVLESA
jgi:hypothetical protein